jgi:hypothetical protein
MASAQSKPSVRSHRNAAHVAVLEVFDPGMRKCSCKMIVAAALRDSWSDTPGAEAQRQTTNRLHGFVYVTVCDYTVWLPARCRLAGSA